MSSSKVLFLAAGLIASQASAAEFEALCELFAQAGTFGVVVSEAAQTGISTAEKSGSAFADAAQAGIQMAEAGASCSAMAGASKMAFDAAVRDVATFGFAVEDVVKTLDAGAQGYTTLNFTKGQIARHKVANAFRSAAEYVARNKKAIVIGSALAAVALAVYALNNVDLEESEEEIEERESRFHASLNS